MKPEPDDLETTAGAPAPAARKPTRRSSRSRPAANGNGKRGREAHPHAALTQQLGEAADTFLRREYGLDGTKTSAAVVAAIEAAGAELVPHENRLAAIATLTEAAQAALLERRGQRELGTVTRLGMAITTAGQ